MKNSNPLLKVAELPRFEDIKDDHIEDAVDKTIDTCSEKILIETEESKDISWKGLMSPLEEISRSLSSSWGCSRSSYIP